MIVISFVLTGVYVWRANGEFDRLNKSSSARGKSIMKRVLTALAATLPFAAHAADAITGEVQRQPTNWQAIIMFLIFVRADAVHHLLGLETRTFA